MYLEYVGHYSEDGGLVVEPSRCAVTGTLLEPGDRLIGLGNGQVVGVRAGVSDDLITALLAALRQDGNEADEAEETESE